MDSQTAFVPLRDMVEDFLYASIVRAIHQAAEMEAAMKLHQERMKDVCYSIRAHYHWENFGFLFPEFSLQCKSCGETISPEFDRGRHLGLCELKEQLADEAADDLSAHEAFYPHLYEG